MCSTTKSAPNVRNHVPEKKLGKNLRPVMEIHKEIHLTDEEEELFKNMLIIFDKVLKEEPYSLLVAGGWVRDKVL